MTGGVPQYSRIFPPIPPLTAWSFDNDSFSHGINWSLALVGDVAETVHSWPRVGIDTREYKSSKVRAPLYSSGSIIHITDEVIAASSAHSLARNVSAPHANMPVQHLKYGLQGAPAQPGQYSLPPPQAAMAKGVQQGGPSRPALSGITSSATIEPGWSPVSMPTSVYSRSTSHPTSKPALRGSQVQQAQLSQLQSTKPGFVCLPRKEKRRPGPLVCPDCQAHNSISKGCGFVISQAPTCNTSARHTTIADYICAICNTKCVFMLLCICPPTAISVSSYWLHMYIMTCVCVCVYVCQCGC